ncbi:hypothetical protein AVEN_95648-1 [Araneus ventricosus]|uniref:Uncharacterized protein n=1 Tax=Araneus ventricosus TaxID=182803 RepID=A0A4Y2WXX4_ARAVE|nr:hypothetical protein AVEN_95648-1 [Araneus ventricosus]
MLQTGSTSPDCVWRITPRSPDRAHRKIRYLGPSIVFELIAKIAFSGPLCIVSTELSQDFTVWQDPIGHYKPVIKIRFAVPLRLCLPSKRTHRQIRLADPLDHYRPNCHRFSRSYRQR